MREHLLEECLSTIVDNPDLHARWLNTFSFLEYVGFRKILKSQAADSMSLETLGHVVEEGRHSLQLKRLAVKLGGPAFDNYHPSNLLCGDEAEAYFQTLDRYCDSSFGDLANFERTRLTYLYVTWLVEVRALEIYRLYQSTLQARGLPFVLQGLMKEEEGHLRSVESELKRRDYQFAVRIQDFQRVEQRLYHAFVKALVNRILPDRSEQYANA
jgi:hypothetical protein